MNKLRAVFLRRWPILLVTLLVGAVGGVVSASVGTERGVTFYQAEQVIVANRLSGNPANVSQDALKVKRGEVPKTAAEMLGDDTDPDRLAQRIQTTAEVESNSIKLRVEDVDPEVASEQVQAFAEAFLTVVNAELRSDNSRMLEQLRERTAEARAALEAFDQENGFITRGDIQLPNNINIDALVAERSRLVDALRNAESQMEDAELRTSEREPYSTLGPEAPRVADSQLIEVPESPLFRAGLLGVIGLLLGVGLTLIIERVNQRIDTRDELAELISVPIIAEIGRIPSRKLPTDEQGRIVLDGVWSEHYRRVRSAIQFVQADAEAARARGEERANLNGTPTVAQQAGAVISGHHQWSGNVPRVFLFASALPGEGKSTSTALTGMALAETGDNTLVINADFRRPSIERMLGVSRSPSLADRAELNVERLSVEDLVQPTHVDHLFVAAGGPPTQEVGGRLMAARELAAEAAAQGGTVLIDSSPLRVSNDPIDLLPAVDEVILVVRAGRTTVRSIQDTLELLDMHHAPVLGVVLIGTLAVREMYAYYHSYYQQAAAADEARKVEAATSAPSAGVDAPVAPSASAGVAPTNGNGATGPPVNGVHVGAAADDGPFGTGGPSAPPPFRGPAPRA